MQGYVKGGIGKNGLDFIFVVLPDDRAMSFGSDLHYTSYHLAFLSMVAKYPKIKITSEEEMAVEIEYRQRVVFDERTEFLERQKELRERLTEKFNPSYREE